jgi:hypothetical protein
LFHVLGSIGTDELSPNWSPINVARPPGSAASGLAALPANPMGPALRSDAVTAGSA